jgi:hypothetical protein
MRVFGNGGWRGFVPMLRILNCGEELQLNVGIIESRFSKSLKISKTRLCYLRFFSPFFHENCWFFHVSKIPITLNPKPFQNTHNPKP